MVSNFFDTDNLPGEDLAVERELAEDLSDSHKDDSESCAASSPSGDDEDELTSPSVTDEDNVLTVIKSCPLIRILRQLPMAMLGGGRANSRAGASHRALERECEFYKLLLTETCVARS